MSKERLQHQHQHPQSGNTEARGTAWHYAPKNKGESNHYPGHPGRDVERRLFLLGGDT